MVYFYVSPQAGKNMHKYKYQASDLSLIYNYILSPLADCLVRYVPKTVSANTLTLCGFLCNAGAYVLCALQCGTTLACDVAAPLLWLSIFLYFGWILLDNMDGKQARRLNCSSPLGLIFDHQVDALNVWMTSTLAATALSFGDSPTSVFLWVIASIPFFFATWEEYYMGSMDFPFINGPNEGCMVIGVLFGVRAYYGAEYFLQPSMWPQYQVRDVIVICFCLASTLNGMWNVYRVVSHSGRGHEAAENTLAFWFFQATLFIVYSLSPAHLLTTQTRWVLVCIGCLFAREMAYIQLSHVGGEHYRPLGIINFSLLTALILNTISNFLGVGFIDEIIFFDIITLLAVGSYMHMAYYVALEMSKELKIPVFAVPKPSDNLQIV